MKAVYKGCVWLFAIALVTTIASCNNDLFTAFDFDEDYCQDNTLALSLMPYDDYLDLDTSVIEKWTKADLLILDEAEQRM